MSTEMIKVMDELCKKFGVAVDWTSENVLPYAQELMEKYIRYAIAYNIAQIVFFLMFASVLGIAFIKMLPKANETYWDCNFHNIMTIMLGFALLTASIIFLNTLCENGRILIECWTFPEKVIFDYLKTMQ